VLGEEPLRVLKFSSLSEIFYHKKCNKAALRKMARNCLFFANSHWEMLSKAIGQPLGTADRV
jgi:hypothetical protein